MSPSEALEVQRAHSLLSCPSDLDAVMPPMARADVTQRIPVPNRLHRVPSAIRNRNRAQNAHWRNQGCDYRVTDALLQAEIRRDETAIRKAAVEIRRAEQLLRIQVVERCTRCRSLDHRASGCTVP